MVDPKHPHWKVSARLRGNARALRRNSTDGGQHFSDEGERADARRSADIEARGFKVVRFSNLDVMTNRPGVLETIATTVSERAPTPALPRKRKRERTVYVEKKQP